MATSLWCAAARRSSCCVQRDVPLKEVIAKTLACGSCPGILRPGTCSRTFSSLRRLPSSIRSTRYPKRAASLLQSQCRRNLETESAYHPVANEALDLIQDAVDDLLDSQTSIDYEVSLASGVLTIKLPPHGTWVINKQTPNLQLWVRSISSVVQCFVCVASLLFTYIFDLNHLSGRVLCPVRNALNTTMLTDCGSRRKTV